MTALYRFNQLVMPWRIRIKEHGGNAVSQAKTMKNFPLGFISDDALQIVGQSGATQYGTTTTHRRTDFRLKADLLAIHSEAIETHKWFLSEKLGRDVGFHVAAADYLENVNTNERSTFRRRASEAFKSRVEKLLALNVSFDGPSSLLNFERAMRGTRSLAR